MKVEDGDGRLPKAFSISQSEVPPSCTSPASLDAENNVGEVGMLCGARGPTPKPLIDTGRYISVISSHQS